MGVDDTIAEISGQPWRYFVLISLAEKIYRIQEANSKAGELTTKKINARFKLNPTAEHLLTLLRKYMDLYNFCIPEENEDFYLFVVKKMVRLYSKC